MYRVWIYRVKNQDEFFDKVVFRSGSFPYIVITKEFNQVGKITAYGNDAFKERFARDIYGKTFGYRYGDKLPDGLTIEWLSKKDLEKIRNDQKEKTLKKARKGIFSFS